MHGRPRQPKGVPINPEKKKLADKKLLQVRQLTNEVLQNAKDKKYDAEFLALSALLLQKNPDIYTVWNYRREATQELLKGAKGPEAAREAAVVELQVTEAALMENPKSYGAWHHRGWVVSMGLTPVQAEIQQVNRLLELDSRNFLAWAYRRQMVRLAGTPPEEEEAYSRKLIDDNFSNYSAWHARISLLTEMHAARRVVSLSDLIAGPAQPSGGSGAPAVPVEALDEEYELTQQAFFTDPEDQSAYMYHRWLLNTSMAHAKAAQGTPQEESAKQEAVRVFQREEGACRELLEVEPDRSKCKWPLLTLARILDLQVALGGVDRAQARRESLDLYAQLEQIDPMRQGYYRDAAAAADASSCK